MGQSSERARAGASTRTKARTFGKHRSTGSFNYTRAEDIGRLVQLVAESGDRISFGYTSGGHCASVSLLTGSGKPETFYARDEEEWHTLLDDVLEGYDDGEKDAAWA